MFAEAGARVAAAKAGGRFRYTANTGPDPGSSPPRMKLQSVLLGTTLTMLLALHASTIDTVFPAIPDIRSEFAVGAGAGQLSMSAFVYAFAAGQLVYGPLSDRFGRRPVLLWSMSLFTLGAVLAAMAGSFETLVASRVLQGIGAGAAPTVARAVIRDVYGPERSGQVMSYIMAAFGLIAVANPIVGGVLTDWFGWRAIFVYMTAYGAIVLVLVWYRLAETLAVRDLEGLRLRRLLRNYRVLLTDRRFVAITVCTCCVHAAMFGWLSGGVLVFIESWGATPSLAGTYISVSLGGFILGSVVAGRISTRMGSTRLIGTGNLICLSSAAIALVPAFAGAQSAPLMIAPATAFMFGLGFVIPPGVAAAIAPFPSMAGAASSFLGFCQISASSTVILISGYLYDGTMRPVALTMTVLAGLGLTVFAAGMRGARAR